MSLRKEHRGANAEMGDKASWAGSWRRSRASRGDALSLKRMRLALRALHIHKPSSHDTPSYVQRSLANCAWAELRPDFARSRFDRPVGPDYLERSFRKCPPDHILHSNRLPRRALLQPDDVVVEVDGDADLAVDGARNAEQSMAFLVSLPRREEDEVRRGGDLLDDGAERDLDLRRRGVRGLARGRLVRGRRLRVAGAGVGALEPGMSILLVCWVRVEVRRSAPVLRVVAKGHRLVHEVESLAEPARDARKRNDVLREVRLPVRVPAQVRWASERPNGHGGGRRGRTTRRPAPDSGRS